MTKKENGEEMRKIKCPKRFKSIWRGMLRRVDDSGYHSYHRYGGRGIRVSERWRRFKNFYDDMYEKYLAHSERHTEKDTTIDRIDYDKGYHLSNCRWVNRKQQGSNTARNVYVIYKGVSLTFSEFSRIVGIDRKTLYYRIRRLGMTPEQAVDTLRLTNNKAANHARWVTGPAKYEYRGKEYTVSELAAHVGMNLSTLRNRLQMYKWPVEDAVNRPINSREKVT